VIEVSEVVSPRGVSVRRILQAARNLASLPGYNFLPFSSMLLRLFGHGPAPTLPNLSLKFDLPKAGARKDVEKSAPFLCVIPRIAISPHGCAPGEEELK
jgi:hypothetical protein